MKEVVWGLVTATQFWCLLYLQHEHRHSLLINDSSPVVTNIPD